MTDPNWVGRRRSFLESSGGCASGRARNSGHRAQVEAAAETATLPQIQIGTHSFSRLICGANPFNGGSHLSVFVNRAMKEYYTPEQVFQTLRRCQEVGINTWQSGVSQVEMYRQFVDQGLEMQYIAIAAGEPSTIDKLAEGGCIGIAHHGEVTDRLFKEGKSTKHTITLRECAMPAC